MTRCWWHPLWGLVLAGWLGTVSAQPGQPDERVLWQLYHAGKYPLLRQAIREYEQRYPGWSPPRGLVRAAGSSRRFHRSDGIQMSIGKAIRTENWPELIRLAERHPAYFRCSRWAHLRVLALAYARTGRLTEAVHRYRQLLSCRRTPRREILEEAFWQLPSPGFGELLRSVRSRVSAQLHADLDYRNRRRDVFAARQQQHWQRLAGGLLDPAVQRHDLELIALVAWSWMDRRNWVEAVKWFQAGLGLSPDNSNFALGLLQAYSQLGEDGKIMALAGKYAGHLHQQAADYLLGRAWELYRAGNYGQSHRYARQAGSWLADPRPAEFLLGWLDLEKGAYGRAQRRFERLYRRSPQTAGYAEALVASHLRAGTDPAELARRFPQATVQKLLAPHLARQSYHRKQFLRARHQDPGSFPQLDNIDRPSLGAAVLYRFKSGNSGLDRLHSFVTPLVYGEHPVGVQHFAVHLGLLVLRSGELHGSGIRALQSTVHEPDMDAQGLLEQEAGALRADLPTRAVEAAMVEFSYHRAGPLNPYFTLGLTPLGGPLAPRPTFRLGVGDWLSGFGPTWRLRWNAEGYSQPVRQSLLSYSGWKMLGRKWGRVLGSGLGLTGLLQREGSGWSLYHALDAAFLDGQSTKDNWRIGYTVAPGYDFGLPDFDYFTLGPYFNFIHYGNNQNHFRPGHGGYFSPQEFYAGGVQLGLLTREGRRYMLEGRLGIGVQHFREGRAAWYPKGCGEGLPLCSSRPDYPENRETSFAPSVRIRMVWQVHPHLQLAGGIYGQRTSGYNEFGAGVALRLLFHPRPAVFSSDLPASLFGIVE